ncbi:hypothetical protein EJ03DRAFT_195703 [Teratosphaeria nubilosa]|uniref:Uncharacterized protein n=1 Tax=Teratosphaeria nubilosa TaxID=161662 RepID=A0A6G1KZV2_9PEZI|nr:hypothetical protein EJ03DRAFT_195703 [Teratosphaeria nubilosa]
MSTCYSNVALQYLTAKGRGTDLSASVGDHSLARSSQEPLSTPSMSLRVRGHSSETTAPSSRAQLRGRVGGMNLPTSRFHSESMSYHGYHSILVHVHPRFALHNSKMAGSSPTTYASVSWWSRARTREEGLELQAMATLPPLAEKLSMISRADRLPHPGP